MSCFFKTTLHLVSLIIAVTIGYQAKLGMVKPFLKTYYNTFSALADRETYTFWEHLYHASPHKTHEEAWFLMETRWMLYMEDGSTLRLLNTIPREWMEDGKTIELNDVQSYFGPLNRKSKVRDKERVYRSKHRM